MGACSLPASMAARKAPSRRPLFPGGPAPVGLGAPLLVREDREEREEGGRKKTCGEKIRMVVDKTGGRGRRRCGV